MSSFNPSVPYDPPVNPPVVRRRAASLSAGSAAPTYQPPRRQSTLGSSTTPSLPPSYHDDTDSSENGTASDGDEGVGEIHPKLTRLGQGDPDGLGDPIDEAIDARNARPGRMSKGWEKPGTTHSTDMESFLAQVGRWVLSASSEADTYD